MRKRRGCACDSAPERTRRGVDFRRHPAFRCHGWSRFGARGEDALAPPHRGPDIGISRRASAAPAARRGLHVKAVATAERPHGGRTGTIVRPGEITFDEPHWRFMMSLAR